MANVFTKVFEHRFQKHITTTDNQVGFKSKHYTDPYINIYTNIGTEHIRFMCFLDAPKAFDKVNHQLFVKLQSRGVVAYVIRIFGIHIKLCEELSGVRRCLNLFLYLSALSCRN